MKKEIFEKAVKQIKPDFILVRWWKIFINYVKSFGDEKQKEVEVIPENVNVIKPMQSGKDRRAERRYGERLTKEARSTEIRKLKRGIKQRLSDLKKNN